MVIDRSLLLRVLAGALVVLVAWLVFEFSPDRQLDKSFARLISAAENRDFKSLREIMDPDYRDQWNMDRTQAVSAASEALGQFLFLRIVTENMSGSRQGREATIAARLRFSGRANAVGEAILQHVNALEDDFRFAWRRKSWKPWDWKLVSVSQNEIQFDPMELP